MVAMGPKKPQTPSSLNRHDYSPSLFDIVDILVRFAGCVDEHPHGFALYSISDGLSDSIPWLGRGMRHQLACIDYGNTGYES